LPVDAQYFDVVLVDDAPEVRDVVGHALRLSGRFNVVAEGESGSDAIELVARHQPALLLLDASMPGTDGLESIPGVRQASPHTVVVMLSGFDAPTLQSKAIELGAHAYIDKSTPVRQLSRALLAVLGVGGEPAGAPASGDLHQHDEGDALREHLERFRTVFDQAAIGMATLTLAGRIVRANRALATLVGWDEAALVGTPYTALVLPAARDTFGGAIAALAQGRAASRELEHELTTGTWVRATVAAVGDSHGRPLYLFAQAEDVTHRRRTIEELRASEERFRLMVESVQDYAIFMLDPEGHIATWNLGAERMKGYRAEEIIGRHFRTFYTEEARATRHPEHELDVALREGRYEEEGWRVRKDGSMFWANVVITALFGPGRRLIGFAKVTRDMTERRRATEAQERGTAELAASAAQLAEANAGLQSAAERTEEFLAVTAHELQSPVSAITGAADILLDYWDQLGPDERRETLGHITRGGMRIRRLLADLLTASRLEAGAFELRPEAVDVESAVKEAQSEASSADVMVVVGAGHAVRADPTRLVQILTNLMSNAVKYGRPPIIVEARRCGGDIEIDVCDHGKGLSNDLAPVVFEKFVRGSGVGNRGTGLGLFIVRELARLQGGDAWYEPRPDGGACFAVRLPAAD
jgi:PAS domain S-box-containing protein